MAAPWPTAQQAQHCMRSVFYELRERAVWRAQHRTIQSSQHHQHCVAVVSTARVQCDPHNPAWHAQHSRPPHVMLPGKRGAAELVAAPTMLCGSCCMDLGVPHRPSLRAPTCMPSRQMAHCSRPPCSAAGPASGYASCSSRAAARCRANARSRRRRPASSARMSMNSMRSSCGQVQQPFRCMPVDMSSLNCGTVTSRVRIRL